MRKLNATDEEVERVARAAGCDGFIRALDQGYDTICGEGGGHLSGGEKQRISIARAMLKDAPIVILDEAAASVDPENEEQLQEAIDALTHNKTIIMIAHRLKTVRSADQILVLNGGKITQRGTHEELAKQPGLYADFLHAREEGRKLEAGVGTWLKSERRVPKKFVKFADTESTPHSQRQHRGRWRQSHLCTRDRRHPSRKADSWLGHCGTVQRRAV